MLRRSSAVLLVLGVVLLGGAILVLLDGAGVLELDPRLTLQKSLAANLVLYWLLASALVLGIRHRRRLLGLARARKGPLIAAVLSLVVAIVGSELALEALDIPPERPAFRLLYSTERHHGNPASSVTYDKSGNVIHTQEDGFRSPYSREEFRRFGTRIAVLGDSYVFGVAMDEDSLVTKRLEELLRERLHDPDVAVLNMGTISYSPLLHRTVVRRVLAEYRPTCTLLLLDGNDIGDDYKYGLDSHTGPDGEPIFDAPHQDAMPHELRLARLARPLLDRLAAPAVVLEAFFPSTRLQGDFYRFELEIDGVLETNRWFILRHPLELTRPYFDTTMGYVRDIAKDVAALGSSFRVYVLPRYFQWSDRECPDNWAGHRYARDEPHEYAMFDYFAEAAEEVDFPVVSLLPAFQATDEFPLVFPNDPHWNAAGHAFVAERLADDLLESGHLR